MKKVIYSIVFFMSVSIVAFSQNGGKMQQKERKDFAKELNLSDEQKTKVKELNDTYKVKVDELRKNSSLSKEERRKQMRDLSNQKHNDMKQILTADQITKLDARKDRRQDFKQGPRKGKGQNQRPPMMRRNDNCRMDCMKTLNLTEDQKSKMKELSQQYAEKRKALRDEQTKAFEGILTADQKAKLDSLKDTRPRMMDRRMGDRPRMQKPKDCCVMMDKKELSQEVKDKIATLKETFEKEKQTIMNTRIAPEVQRKRVEELRKKFIEDKRAILKEAFPKK